MFSFFLLKREFLISLQSSTSSTPKATPLQSPGVEVAPTSHSDEMMSVTTVTSVTTVGNEMHSETVTVAVSEITSVTKESESVEPEKIESDKPCNVPETVKPIEEKQTPVVIDKQPTKQENEFITSPPLQQSQQETSNELPEGDMTGMNILLYFFTYSSW